MRYIFILFIAFNATVSISQGSLDLLEEHRPIEEITTVDHNTLVLGTTTKRGDGPSSYLLIKKDEKDIEQWSMTYGGSSYDRAADILELPKGGYLLLGSTSSFGKGNYDVLVYKIDENGVKKWQKTFGAFHNDYGVEFVESEQGTIIIKSKRQFCDIKNDFSTCTYGDWYIQISEKGKLIAEQGFPFKS